MKSLLLATILVLFSFVSTAHADIVPSRPDARRHLAAGDKLFAIKAFEEAVAEYKQGALIESSAIFHYNLGQCYRQMGRYEDAIWHYEQFLAKAAPEGEVLEAVNSFISQMRSELDKKAMTQAPVEPASLPAEHSRTQKSAIERPWYTDSVGWAFIGAGAVTLSVSSALLLDSASLNTDADGTKLELQRTELRHKAQTRATWGVVTGIAGVALASAGIAKFVLHRRSSSNASALRLGVSPGVIFVSGCY